MLNNFSSYFEIFGGLNLAYAGSKGFRNAIDDEILKLKNEILPNINLNIEKLKSEFIVLLVSDDNGEIIDNKLNNLVKKFDVKSEEILESEKVKINFTEGFKSMFLGTALYCIALILIGGYEQYFTKGSHLINLFLLILYPVFFFNFFIFLRSFTKNHHKNIKPLVTIFFVSGLILIGYLTIFYCPYESNIENYLSESICISFSLIIAISPYLFHFFRVYIHKLNFRFQFYMLESQINKEIKKISELINFLSND